LAAQLIRTAEEPAAHGVDAVAQLLELARVARKAGGEVADAEEPLGRCGVR
jgi:hypothetical protein